MATQNEIAEHLGCTPRTVRNLLKTGVLPPARPGAGLDPEQCRHAICSRYFAGQSAEDAGVGLEEARTRNLEADTRLKELKEAQLRKELAPIQLLESILAHIGARQAAILGSIAAKVRRRVPSLTAGEVELINREIIKCQNAAADGQSLLADWTPDGDE